MIDRLITKISLWVVAAISTLGYGGVILMMALESACIPVPSEVIMPFSGYLVSTGRFGLQMAAIAGAVGCLVGSYAAYYVGATGGRRLIESYGKWVLISHHELEIADKFFEKWGAHAVFFSRLLPVIRTYIAFPAGVSRMKLWPFTIYTLIGSYLWCLALAYIGMKLGEDWHTLGPYFHRFDTVIVVIMVVPAAWFVYNRIQAAMRK
ncbi:MAG TPA: DedA family protein [Candidatus Binataceae bacterium]|nr:DedA family protein [Candidatus Binataceae bacterium]